MAALNSPTYFEVKDVLPRAMREMGLAELTRTEAALRLAKNQAKEILHSGEDPLKHTRDFARLWINAGYPSELASVGTLDDEVFISSQSEDQIRRWVTERLRELIRGEACK